MRSAGAASTPRKCVQEIVDFIASGTTPQSVIAFRPSEEAQRRVQELVELSKETALSPAEQSELEDFLELEHLMILAKARARQL